MSTTAPVLTTYVIDKAHSEATFHVRHLLSKVRGHFADFSGTLQWDDADPVNSSVEFTIDASSINTNQPDRDAHLRSDDFFAVEKFPRLTFVSHRVTRVTEDRFDVSGQLTLRGVTREVVLPVKFLGRANDPWGKERLAFSVETTLNRHDYGLNWNAALETGGFLVGETVTVQLELQTVRA